MSNASKLSRDISLKHRSTKHHMAFTVILRWFSPFRSDDSSLWSSLPWAGKVFALVMAILVPLTAGAETTDPRILQLVFTDNHDIAILATVAPDKRQVLLYDIEGDRLLFTSVPEGGVMVKTQPGGGLLAFSETSGKGDALSVGYSLALPSEVTARAIPKKSGDDRQLFYVGSVGADKFICREYRPFDDGSAPIYSMWEAGDDKQMKRTAVKVFAQSDRVVSEMMSPLFGAERDLFLLLQRVSMSDVRISVLKAETLGEVCSKDFSCAIPRIVCRGMSAAELFIITGDSQVYRVEISEGGVDAAPHISIQPTLQTLPGRAILPEVGGDIVVYGGPRGKAIYVNRIEGDTFRKQYTISVSPAGRTSPFALSPDGNILALAENETTLSFWRIGSEKAIKVGAFSLSSATEKDEKAGGGS